MPPKEPTSSADASDDASPTAQVSNDDPPSDNNGGKQQDNNKMKKPSNMNDKIENPPPVIQFMTGMIEDLKARVPLYMDDWKRPQSILRVVNATLFAFVVQLIPALIFAELLDRQTEGSLAVAEVLLSAGIIGIIYALITGQPLVLLGITGPVAILLGTSYSLAEQFDAKYFTFFWWLCIWTAVLHLLTAIVGLVNFVWQMTPFSSQIFEFFIAMSFIYESIRDLVEPIHFSEAHDEYGHRSAAYASLVIGIGTFVICWSLHFAETWVYWTREVRTFLTSYNMMIAIVLMTAFSYLPGVHQEEEHGGVERVNIRTTPWNWKPTATPTRPWLTDPFDGIDSKGIFGALFPAFMLYLLFFIDHNISSILTQAPKFNLKKPPAYHWDFFCLGLTIIPCGLLGLPPGSGLIPQAPLHTRALAAREHVVDEHGVKHEVVTHVEEQRWSALLQASLMFVALSCIVVISWIPVGCLFGVFLYLGVGAMHGNEIWERITLSCMLPKKRPNIPIVQQTSSWTTVQLFTVLQVSCAVLIFGIAQFASVGYIFPALVAGLVPLRTYVVSRLFSEEDLKHLDPVGETEEDYRHEQHEILEAHHRRPSFDESELPTGFSEFRASGVPHDAHQHETLRQRHLAPKDDDGSIVSA